MICDLNATPIESGGYRVICQRCGRSARANRPDPRIRCNRTPAPAKPGPCRQIGPEQRRVECDGCKGTVLIKIFACSIHGECTIGRKIDPIACCKGCADYASTET